MSEPPLAGASVANIENCFIKSNVDFTAANGWLRVFIYVVGSSDWLGLFVSHLTSIVEPVTPISSATGCTTMMK